MMKRISLWTTTESHNLGFVGEEFMSEWSGRSWLWV